MHSRLRLRKVCAELANVGGDRNVVQRRGNHVEAEAVRQAGFSVLGTGQNDCVVLGNVTQCVWGRCVVSTGKKLNLVETMFLTKTSDVVT